MSDVAHNEPELRPEESFEPDHPAAGLLFVQVFALSIVTIVLMLIGWRVWVWGTQHTLYEQQGLPLDARLMETRQRDEASLKDYGVADAEKGRYRIPIDQAMLMLVADSKLLAPEPPPPPVAPSAPATPTPDSAATTTANSATPTDSAAPAPAATATPQAPAPPTK